MPAITTITPCPAYGLTLLERALDGDTASTMAQALPSGRFALLLTGAGQQIW